VDVPAVRLPGEEVEGGKRTDLDPVGAGALAETIEG
jgi:hypothetical protein